MIIKEEFYQRGLNILADISKSLEPAVFWKNWNFWSFVALLLTLIYIIKSTRATEKMVENQSMPAVDVNMIYDNQQKKTYFWFLNASSIPALISMELKIKEKQHSIGPLRIAPYHPQIFHFKKTATSHDFLEGQENNPTEAILEIEVKPAFDNQKIKSCFTKNYRFNTANKEWDESTWSYPDLPFPQQKQNS